MHRFAHITDCHLGAWRNIKLRELNLKAFEEAISICIDEHVDFIVITGDFFDLNIPDLAPVKRAVEILREARKNGIEIYMIYGSHDFTASTVSIIDILHSAGLFIKPVEFEQVEDKIKLKFFEDVKTVVKITGLSGRKTGLDAEYYSMLDMDALESEEGFKIFLFHAPISELTPIDLARGDTIPLSLLPKGFRYYGGGHLHRRIERKHDGNSMIVYPGPLFGATFTDLEETARGERRGFYIVEADSESVKPRFIEIKVIDIIFKLIGADQKTAKQVEDTVSLIIDGMDVSGKIVLIKIKGTLISGKSSDINFSRFEEVLSKKGALVTSINRSALTSTETTQVKVLGESIEDIEKKIIKETTASFKLDPAISDEKVKSILNSRFVGELAQSTAKQLLQTLKTEKFENESVSDYEKRVRNSVKSILGVGDNK